MNKKTISYWPLFWSFVFVAAMMIANILIPKGSGSERGTFGDQFGMSSAVFSGLAFALLIYTMLLQKRDLENQKIDLEEQKKLLAKQIAAQYLDRFENTLFNLIQGYSNLVSGLKLKEANGQEVFPIYFAEIANSRKPIATEDKSSFSVFLEAYSAFVYPAHAEALAPYFRTLYHLVVFVDQADLPEEKKKFYMKMVRARLSGYELVVLGMNCCTKNGVKKFKPLIEKYGLLKHITELRDYPKVTQGIREEYSPAAFGVKWENKMDTLK